MVEIEMGSLKTDDGWMMVLDWCP